MKKYLAVLVLIFFMGCTKYRHRIVPVIRDGVMDARDWDAKSDGLIGLYGYWEFFPGQLLNPNKIQSSHFSGETIKVPGVWTSRYPRIKYATYRLTIKNLKDGFYDLKVYDIGHAYKMWLNGRPILSNGQVSTNRQEFRSGYRMNIYHSIRPRNGNVELVVQVANFAAWRAGIWKSMYLGTQRQIESLTFMNLSRDLIVFGFLIALGLYHFFLVFTRKQDLPAFLLGLSALLLAMKIFPEGERIIYYVFPFLSGDNVLRLAYIGYYGSAFIFPFYIASLFDDTKNPIILSHHWLSFPFLLTLLFPLKIFAYFLPAFHILTLYGMTGILTVIIRGIIKKKQDAVLMLIIIMFFFCVAINDILNSLEIIQTAFISYYGFSFILLTQGWILAARFSRAFEENNLLKEENYRSYLKEKELNELKTQFLSTASHEFKTPLAVIQTSVDLFENHWEELDKVKRNEYFSRIHRSITRITDMMNDVLYLSRVENKETPPDFMSVNLGQISLQIVEEMRLSYGKNKKEVVLQTEGEVQPCMMDVGMFRVILTNLVGNAVKFSPNNCRVKVLLCYENNGVEINISDKGLGIPSEELTHIFKRFFRGKGVRNYIPGTGLGLAIVKKTMDKLKGKIEVSSEEGKGTSFRLFFDCTNKERGNK